jgi:hypothetical protein
VALTDQHGEVAFHPLPYAEPTFARALPGAEVVTDHQAGSYMSIRLWLQYADPRLAPTCRS